jgi:hypothetical protein
MYLIPACDQSDHSRKSLWGSEIADNPPVVDHKEIMDPATSRTGLGKWTKNIVPTPEMHLI